MTDAYATAAEYRASIDKVDTSEDAEVLIDLTSVSRHIEKRLAGRFFTKDASAAVRIYKPRFPNILEVDDIVTLTSIKVDAGRDGTYETTLTAAEYELTPRNAADGPEPSPYTAIERLTGAWANTSRVEVTAVFGWPAVPAAIKSACIQITAMLRLETPRAQSQVTDLGSIVSVNTTARNLIDNLILDYGRLTL